jgi:hypothetical protein
MAHGLMAAPGVLRGDVLNPDSAMRLVRLYDIVASGQPLHAVMRDASGSGAIMSWSHFMDSLLLLLAAPLAGVLGWPGALHAAALAWSPLCMAGLGVAVAWAVAPAASRVTLCLAAIAVGMATATVNYGTLGIVHHHIPIAVATVMAWGWAVRLLAADGLGDRDAVAGGIAMGAWTAAGIWLSPEALPFALMATGAVWLDWLMNARRTNSMALLAAGLTMAALVALAWLVDPPAAGLMAAEPDRISVPFMLLSLGAAVAALVAHCGLGRWAALATGGVAAVLWLWAFPQVLHGTAGLMSAEEASAFFGRIEEMQPIDSMETALAYLPGGLLALISLLAFAWRRRPVVPILYAAACAAGMLALAVAHVRFAAYPAIAGALMLPVVLSAIDRSALPTLFQSLGRIACLVGLIGTPALAPLAAVAADKQAAAAKGCKLDGATALLANHPGVVVLADINDGPELLYRTQVVIVGSLYHRNIDGFMRLRAAWREMPGDEPGNAPGAAFRATHATLVLGCPGGGRSMLLDGLPTETLLDRLAADQPPSWLRRVADAGPGGYVLYEVAR